MSDCINITIVVVTSPSPSNPSVELLSQCIESCSLVDGLEGCPVIIMMDGFKVASTDRTKVGRITEDSARRYEQYYEAILKTFTSPRFRVVRNSEHQGFALTVKAGLELCSTTYSLVAQYDRMFCARFDKLNLLLKTMKDNPHIRYIGFPTSTNINHDKFISTNYNLYCLNKPDIKMHLGDHLYLQPLVFWFDSQHLCHVERYLQIYRPYKNLPPHLRELIGIKSIKDMLLRPGDFIEDRFGQMQRRLLWSLAVKGRVDTATGELDDSAAAAVAVAAEDEVESHGGGDAEQQQADTVCDEEGDIVKSGSSVNAREAHSDVVLQLFRWYGSYLCWQNTSPTPYDVHLAHDHSDTLVMVRHLRGRQLNSAGVAWKLGTFTEAGAAVGGYWKEPSGSGAGPVTGSINREVSTGPDKGSGEARGSLASHRSFDMELSRG